MPEGTSSPIVNLAEARGIGGKTVRQLLEVKNSQSYGKRFNGLKLQWRSLKSI